MKIPPGYSRDQVIADIDHVVVSLAKHFRFGYHENEDMQQEGYLFALDGLERYDPKANTTLRSFLFTHVRNRFINMRRNKYNRHAPPCSNCPFYIDDVCNAFDECRQCERYTSWLRRNEVKRSLMETCEADARTENTHALPNTQLDKLLIQEAITLVDKQLPLDMRSDYCKMRDGAKLPKARRREIEQVVLAIVEQLI